MLLTITTTHSPATDLGYLLHKLPGRFQSFDLSFGMAHVFYPKAEAEECTACLLLDVDPVGMVRGKRAGQGPLLSQYVNDRPYVASSFMSVAISPVFGSALQGRCNERSEVVQKPLPLAARIDVLPVRGGEGFLHRIFEPLGYRVDAVRHPLDERFPEWGESPYFSVALSGTKTLSELLTHLYVPIPVLFEFARPRTVVLTTPNREYNLTWQSLPARKFRHPDHRFEWDRSEFQQWSRGIAERYNYSVRFVAVGPESDMLGSPTQMGLFERDCASPSGQ